MENIVSTQEKRCYTVKELQEILGISRPTVYELLKKNEFRWIQIGTKGNRALMPAVLAGVILLVWILHQVTQLV